MNLLWFILDKNEIYKQICGFLEKEHDDVDKTSENICYTFQFYNCDKNIEFVLLSPVSCCLDTVLIEQSQMWSWPKNKLI